MNTLQIDSSLLHEAEQIAKQICLPTLTKKKLTVNIWRININETEAVCRLKEKPLPSHSEPLKIHFRPLRATRNV